MNSVRLIWSLVSEIDFIPSLARLGFYLPFYLVLVADPKVVMSLSKLSQLNCASLAQWEVIRLVDSFPILLLLMNSYTHSSSEETSYSSTTLVKILIPLLISFLY